MPRDPLPNGSRDEYICLVESSHFSLEGITALMSRYCLRNVSVPCGEPPFDIVFLRALAMAHANKQGLQRQLNPGGFARIPIVDVTSIFDRETITFRFSYDSAEGRLWTAFAAKGAITPSYSARCFGAVMGRALVQDRSTVNRHNLSEAHRSLQYQADVCFQASHSTIRMRFCRATIFAADYAVPSILLQQSPARPTSTCGVRQKPRLNRPCARAPINITRCAEQPHFFLADAA